MYIEAFGPEQPVEKLALQRHQYRVGSRTRSSEGVDDDENPDATTAKG